MIFLAAAQECGVGRRVTRALRVGLATGVFALLATRGLALAEPVQATTTGANAADPLGRYLSDLEHQGRLRAEAATLPRLRERLATAEEQLVRGDVRAAAAGLFALVEDQRFAAFRDTVPYQNAELLLGRALLRGGAHDSAERYLLRVLARGPKGAYVVPAHRALVDLALETRAYERLLAALETTAPAAAIPDDSRAERAYLRGRLHYQRGALGEAEGAFAEVPRTSRLYAGATYFRGLVAARRGAYGDARGAFCQILPGKTGETLAFNVDGRYYQLQDLARLALGRIAHEQDRYDEAYYFYFSIPEDSDRLAEALFEAAYSMYQKGEAKAARTFAEAFEQTFPDAPQRAEVDLLRAHLAVKSCAFDEARTLAGGLVGRYEAAQKLAAASAADPARARLLARRLLARRGSNVATADAEGRVLSLLKFDDRWSTLERELAEIDVDLAEAEAAREGWRALGAVAAGGNATYRSATTPEAAQLYAEVEALVPELGEAPELSPRVEALLAEAQLLAFPPRQAGPYAEEEAAAAAMITRLVGLRRELHAAAETLVTESLHELDERLRALFRQTRLIHIDAVVGRKKRLEIEIANLRGGRYGGALYAKLKAEGALGDDEEYWPFEGEYWADEYENFK